MGRSCVDHYASMKRQCVFSNDELLLVLAEVVAGDRDINDAVAWTDLTADRYTKIKPLITGFDVENLRTIHDEFSLVLEKERELREHLQSIGLTNVEQVRLDELPDDDRVCFVCQTTLFLSAVTCPCKQSAIQSSHPPTRTGTKKRKSAEHDTENVSGKFDVSCMLTLDCNKFGCSWCLFN